MLGIVRLLIKRGTYRICDISESDSAWPEFATQNPCKKIKVMAHICYPSIPSVGWEGKKRSVEMFLEMKNTECQK